MADASTPPPPPPPPSPTTWGAFSSLYSNLSAAEVCHLEKAIELRYLGRYDDAEIIYANELPPARQNPVIAIELATIHERTGDEPCRAQIFRETLDAIEQGEITPPEDVHRYLRILLASSHLYVLGQLRLGFEEARGLRTWLLDVEPHTYTDTMVASVCEYHQIIRQTRKASNWCGPEDGDLPHTGGKEALASLQHLRKLLVAQGRINLAGMVAVQESKTANGMDACSPYRELLDAKQVTDVNDDRPLFYKNLTHQLFLSEAMFAAGMSHHGHALFQAACDEMTASEAIYGQPNRFWILADYTRAEIFPAKPGLQRVSQYHDLAMLAESRREKAIQRWGLMQAYQASEKLVESEESRKDTEGASRIRQASLHQYLHFEMTVTRSPYFSAACLGTVGMHMNSNDQAAEWLEYHRDFWNTWPEFDIPLLGRRLFDEASRASRATGDFESAGLYDQQRDQFLKHCSFIVSSSDTRQDDVFVEDAPDDHFSEWMQIPPGMNHDSPLGERFEWISAKLILRWISNDLTANCITMQDIRSILAISHESIEEMEFEDRPLAFISSIAPHELRSRIFGRNGVPTRQEEWGKWFENVETWLQRKGRPPSNLHRHHLLEQIMEARVLGYQRWAVSLPHSGPVAAESILNQLQMADKRLRLYETIDPSLVNLHKIQACKSWKASALMLLANDPELRERGLGTIESLREASLMFEELVSQSRTPGRLRYLYRHLGSLGRCAWMRYFWYKDATPELGMPYWEEADDVFRRLLSGSAYLADFQCFFAKNLLQEELDHAQVFSNGLKVSLVSWLTFLQTKAEEIRTDRLAVVALPRYQELVRNFVKWSQRAKARCLTDVLGLGAQFPRSMMQEIEASPAAMGLVEEMRALEAQLGSAHLSEKIKIRADLRKLQESMRQEETLVPFLDVLEGVTVRHEELQQMCQGLDESVIFLDWLHISWYDNWDIGCALYENGIFVDFIYCNKLKLRDIKTWVQSYLEPDPRIFDMEEDLKFCPLNSVSARKQLKILEPLAAVFEVIPADWLVVICPTYDLCRIPFHAIEFKGRPLIERNPIIYCQSLTILRLCQLSRNSMLEDMATEDFRPVAFNPLGEDVDTSKTVADLATRLGTVTEDLNQCSKEDFVRLLSEASLIHFHGHVRFDHDDPLKHHLELKPVPHDENQCLGPADILTAQEIFGIKLRKGAHITTISCKSARTAVTNNHELLGLAAALHYAGASSIVSALWNIHRNDGRRFSRAFYDALIREMQVPSPSKPYINLARIMQKAVLAVRCDPDGRIQAPYRWAGLVLHGAWLYPRIPDLELETRSNPDLDPHPLSQSDRRGTW